MNTDARSSPSCGAIADLQEDEDGVYFSSYGHYGIHEEMLKVRKASPLHLPRTEEERWNEVGCVPVNILQSSCIFNPFCPGEVLRLRDYFSVLFPLGKLCLWEALGTENHLVMLDSTIPVPQPCLAKSNFFLLVKNMKDKT